MPELDLLSFVVLVLATYRVARIFLSDDITQPIRDTIFRVTRDGGMVQTFFSCYFCLGFYVSFFVYWLWNVWADSFYLFVPLALSACVGLLAEIFD